MPALHRFTAACRAGQRLRQWLAMGGVSVWLVLTPHTALAAADAYAQVSTLLTQGQAEAALAQIQSHLAQHPQDAQMRFLQGAAQSQAQQWDGAIATYTALTQEFPELPEPHNNLAVIYAHQGQLEAARQALLRAINNNPEYAVAHENLGDIYLRLAHQAYGQSVKLQGAQPAVQHKLQGLQTLLQSTP
ncbi:MAG: tetratricopeptide repeat protein [Comamonas sp.]|nr:tetratricopeptide repeat protein [Comamonas sp.]